MKLTKQKFTSYLKAADFRTLFIEEMGWNKVSNSYASLPTIDVEDKTFDIRAIAIRNGFQVLQCSVKELPSNSTCKKLDIKLRKSANDYICIFIIPGTEHQQWVAPIKTNEKRNIVIIEYAEAEKAQFLYEKIAGLSFDIDEVTTIVDVKERVQGAFAINSEKITKDFYAGFNKEHKAFASFITGIDDQTATKDNKNKQWYTSVMLNRLMFCYFIQKKGFLDGDENYLRNKLRWVQEQRGNDQFFKSFYKGFLVQLFRGGLNSPNHDDAFEDVYGRIPYLNGGMFDVHQIERDYADIDIKDEAFESLFEFFDKWRWHLDTRVTASGRDINPDVLGYIFEQYINDRAQMGAYYTKEDITEYIGRNTIIPYLLDAVAKKHPESFKHDGAFWQFIQNSGDDFIYDAVKKGADQPIPDEIALGIDTEAPDLIERRKAWNNPTPANIGLPTEIWRETIERLQRFNDIKSKIAAGEVKSVNDFITYNLNTPKIAYDFLNTTNDKKFIELFYGELLRVTILDPTCGSGAFLFAALNLLEPLYEVCISRMEEFNHQDHSSFSEQLSEIQNKYRSNIQYFIYKSIILRNLYGVDIMAEAAEIAKLRLFLKMVAVVEVDKRADNLGLDPLPDVDFNIRCGNALVGYANKALIDADLHGDNADIFLVQESENRIKSQLEAVAETYNVFREKQLTSADSVTGYKKAKESLSESLQNLNEELNGHMFRSSGLSSYKKWKQEYQPFHWIAEFYQIIEEGGFDVIIGNPPYVVYSEKNFNYKVRGYKTQTCNDLYAYVIERSTQITRDDCGFGMIVPISIVSTDGFAPLRHLLINEKFALWFSNYAMRPAKLFDGAEKHLSIFVGKREATAIIYSSRYHRWYTDERINLFSNISYAKLPSEILTRWDSFPKLGNRVAINVWLKMQTNRLMSYSTRKQSEFYLYHTRKLRYFVQFLDVAPIIYNEDGSVRETSELKKICFDSDKERYAAIASYLSTLFFWFFISLSDCRNLNKREVDNFPLALKDYNALDELAALGHEILDNLQNNSSFMDANYQKFGKLSMQVFSPRLSKPIADKIDTALANHYHFTQEELDAILNYDIKYRMGEELSAEND